MIKGVPLLHGRKKEQKIVDTIRKIVILMLCFLIFCCTRTNYGMTPRPYLSQVKENSIVVSWQTAVPTPSVVEYGENAAYGFTHKDDVKTRFHCITITGLEPSREYHYRVLSGEKTADYKFYTAVKSGEPFTFAIYGDTQPNDENHLKILRLMMKAQPLFIINMGDLVREDAAYAWNDYFSEICEKTDLGETIPIYSSIGNRDGAKYGSKALYYKYLSLPSNNPDHTEAYYSFNIGDAHFIALDSYLPFDPGSPQYRWLVEDLRASANYQWKIVFLHEPLYSTGKHGSNMRERMILGPLFEENGVRLVFAGHDHLYERSESMKGVTYIVTGGGGASLYNATKAQWVAVIDKSHHFCKILREENHLKVDIIRSDGTVGDRFVLMK